MIGTDTTRTARKDHTCVLCGKVIPAGTRYRYVTELVTHEADVDDEGRTVAFELPHDHPDRGWCTMRMHAGADPAYGCPAVDIR